MIKVDASEQELFDGMSTDNILITFELFLNSLAGKHHHVIYTTGSVTLRLCDSMSKDSHTKLMIRMRGKTRILYENKDVIFSECGYRCRTHYIPHYIPHLLTHVVSRHVPPTP
jgi:hypothetical protein